MRFFGWLPGFRRRKLGRERREELQGILKTDFLGARTFFRDHCPGLVSGEDYELEKVSFVKAWFEENVAGENGEKRVPDDEQASAIAAVDGHVQVVARAGSGKTATLVNRAFFLLEHCGVAADEVLLLAFNRKAALEVRRRLLGMMDERAEAAVSAGIDRRVRKTGRYKKSREEAEAVAVDAAARELNVALPHVMTFHALAYAIVHPEEKLLYDGEEGETQELSSAVQCLINDELRDPNTREQIRALMLAHFREDWDRIVEGGYERSKEEFLRFRRSLSRQSLAGEYVKSYGEKAIANFLFEHDVPYKYEPNFWWGGINYRPDFTIPRRPEGGTVVEYFGLEGDADYDEMSERKRAYWSEQKDWELIEFSPGDISTGSFRDVLEEHLEDRGIPCVRVSEEEIWRKVRGRAVDRFTTSVVGFIGGCRRRALSPAELRAMIDTYSPLSPVEGMFLEIAHRLYTKYLEYLSDTGEEDFDGLMQAATARVNDGQTSFRRKSGSGDIGSLRYVFVDEFQDFSDLFHGLIEAMRGQNPRIELFCVGDDWQAINGFAGSDLKFFERFEHYVGEANLRHISTNYRSADAIVAVGNALMHGSGKPAVAHKRFAGEVLVSDLSGFEPTFLEKQRHSHDALTPAVLRLVSRGLDEGLDVVMLCRRNTVPWYVSYRDRSRGKGGLDRCLDHVRSFFPEESRGRISISTAHKYKGLEKGMVILLDVIARSYPLIHPDWAFSRILGDSIEKITQEERRLLYVALTRAVEKLVIITDGQNKSPLFEELERRHELNAIDWAAYPPAPVSTGSIVVKIGNQEHRGSNPTRSIKEVLKKHGYKYQPKGWCGWVKSFPRDGFEIDGLKREAWVGQADGIEVRILDYTDDLLARHFVDRGSWSTDFDDLDSISG